MDSIQKTLLFIFLLFSSLAIYSQVSCDRLQLSKFIKNGIDLLQFVIALAATGSYYHKSISNITSYTDKYFNLSTDQILTIYNGWYQRSYRYEY